LADIPVQPAVLDVTFTPVVPPKFGVPAISSVILTLGQNETRLPSCVTNFLHTVRLQDIQVLASWYHDQTILPYYVNVKFFDEGYDTKKPFNSGFSIVFNLRTARLIQMQALMVRDQGNSVQPVPIDLASRCSPSEFQKLKDTPR
jgi:hypothetical protein